MKKTYFLSVLLFILAGFSSCKDDECETCPDGYGLVKDECKCLGYVNGEGCYTLDQLLASDPKFEGELFYSFDSNSSENFNFNSNPQLISISPWIETGVNSESAKILLIEDREVSNFNNATLTTTVKKPKMEDSAWFEPFFNEQGFGPGHKAESITKEINGKVCFLRPYLVELQINKLYKLYLKWETKQGEVVDVCTKIFKR